MGKHPQHEWQGDGPAQRCTRPGCKVVRYPHGQDGDLRIRYLREPGVSSRTVLKEPPCFGPVVSG